MKKSLSVLLSLIMIFTAASAFPLHACADGPSITEDMVAFGRTAFVYDGTPKSPAVTVTDGGIVLVEGVNYDVFYRVDAIDVPLMESAPSEAGNYVVIVAGRGSYDGLVERRFSIIEDSPQFGRAMAFGDHTFYVNDESGATSTFLSESNEDENGISWLREESDGTAAWYGFDNTEGALPEGTIVSVKWYGKDTDKDIIQQKLELIDNDNKKLVLGPDSENNNVMLLEIDAEYNGNPIHEFDENKMLKVHVEINNKWNPENVGALYISDGRDEKISVKRGGRIEVAEGATFAIMTLQHCSTYIIYEKKAPASLKKASVSGIRAKTWTGKAVKQKLTVKLSKKTLKNGTDYKVTYKNNTRVGKATVIFKGINSYTGTIKKTFKINPKGTSIKKITAGDKAFTAVWKKQTKQTAGYQLQYSTGRKFTKKTTGSVTVGKNKTVKATVGTLKAGQTYYVRIRTFKTVGKTKYYSAWSKVKIIRTK